MMSFVLNNFQSFYFVGLSQKRGFQPQLIYYGFSVHGGWFFGSLWIPDCFGVHRQSGASESNLNNGDTSGGYRESGHLRFHLRRGDGAFPWPQHLGRERIPHHIQSGGRIVPLGQPSAYALGLEVSGKQRGKVAAALQNVRSSPSMILGSLESIKSLFFIWMGVLNSYLAEKYKTSGPQARRLK